MIDKSFETKEQGLEKLKKGIEIRNKMGGALYWNIVNDDCIEMAYKLFDMGVEKSEINAIFNS
jgi:hypothetical protein